MKEFSIYIHIPFCISKCSYCDFNSYSNMDNMIDVYIDKLISEIKQDKSFSKNDICRTIYIGGGTPSYISSQYIIKILNTIYEKYNIDINAEITIEQNPSTMNEIKLKDYYFAGINRLSIGLQTTNDDLLSIIGRRHTYNQFLDKYYLARQIGFCNINVDLMIGLPNETLEQVEKDILNIIQIKPEHISCYSLILYENVPLYELIKQGKYVLPTEELERNMYYTIEKNTNSNEYIHYEISNFSKKNRYSKHNMMCWQQYEYIGFGAGAHSFVDNIRFCNTENISEYIKNNKINILEVMNKGQLMKEYMLLSMRLITEFDFNRFKQLYGITAFEQFNTELKYLYEKGYIQIVKNQKIELTQKGIDFNNIVCEQFI